MTRNLVVRTIQRADSEVLAGLAAEGVATVHEAIGQTGLMDPAIRPIQAGSRIAGSAITVSCAPGDNIMVHAAVESVQAGDILVVAVTSPSPDAMIGELIATSLRVRGCIGAVVDAGVRDVAELRDIEFPVWSRAVHAQGTVKDTPGSVNLPIRCGGAAVQPGDVIVADDDGVLVVPRLDAVAALEQAQARTATEKETRASLQQGELTVDFYDLRRKLSEIGVEYVDEEDDR